MSETFYERLGGTEGIQIIANDPVDNHAANPRIVRRFFETDLAKPKKMAAEFFIAGSGGLSVYQGEDMPAAQKGFNIDNDEFVAMRRGRHGSPGEDNNVGQREREGVIYILSSMKDDVVMQ